MSKKQIAQIARPVLSILLLALLLPFIDRQAFTEAFSRLRLDLYLIGLLLYICSVSLWAVRWRFFISASGEDINFIRVWATILVGSFFSLFLPTVVGNDLARMYQLSRDGGTNTRIVSTVLLDRLIGLISLVVMALVSLVFSTGIVGGQDSRIAVMTIAAFVALVAGWFVFFNRGLMRRFNWVFRLPMVGRIESRVRTLYESLHQLQTQPRLLITALAVSFAMQIIEIGSIVLSARALNIQTPIVDFFIFVPLIWIVTTIPISISGLGLREGAFAVFFGQVGVSSSDAVALSLLYYSYRLILGIAGGLIFLRSSLRRYTKSNDEPLETTPSTTL